MHQFIDIGSGLPTVGDTYEVVQLVDPWSRVAYVDNDPMVQKLAADLLTDGNMVRVIEGDLRNPDGALKHPDVRALIDFGQPVGLLMTAVVHFVADASDPSGWWRSS